MAALTQAVTIPNFDKIQSCTWNWRVGNTLRLYNGSLIGIPGANALTTYRGYAVAWQNQVNLQWGGIMVGDSFTGGFLASARTGTVANVDSVLGDTSLDPVPEITTEIGPCILREIAVTGVTAQTDVGRTLVYSTSSNYADITTTATSYAPAIGKVVYWNTSTTCAVMLFGLVRSWAIS